MTITGTSVIYKHTFYNTLCDKDNKDVVIKDLGFCKNIWMEIKP